ncbi:MAG: DUF4129 domain-containing protein [Candidatus Omnitrophota bacterium]
MKKNNVSVLYYILTFILCFAAILSVSQILEFWHIGAFLLMCAVGLMFSAASPEDLKKKIRTVAGIFLIGLVAFVLIRMPLQQPSLPALMQLFLFILGVNCFCVESDFRLTPVHFESIFIVIFSMCLPLPFPGRLQAIFMIGTLFLMLLLFQITQFSFTQQKSDKKFVFNNIRLGRRFLFSVMFLLIIGALALGITCLVPKFSFKMELGREGSSLVNFRLMPEADVKLNNIKSNAVLVDKQDIPDYFKSLIMPKDKRGEAESYYGNRWKQPKIVKSGGTSEIDDKEFDHKPGKVRESEYGQGKNKLSKADKNQDSGGQTGEAGFAEGSREYLQQQKKKLTQSISKTKKSYDLLNYLAKEDASYKEKAQAVLSKLKKDTEELKKIEAAMQELKEQSAAGAEKQIAAQNKIEIKPGDLSEDVAASGALGKQDTKLAMALSGLWGKIKAIGKGSGEDTEGQGQGKQEQGLGKDGKDNTGKGGGKEATHEDGEYGKGEETKGQRNNEEGDSEGEEGIGKGKKGEGEGEGDEGQGKGNKGEGKGAEGKGQGKENNGKSESINGNEGENAGLEPGNSAGKNTGINTSDFSGEESGMPGVYGDKDVGGEMDSSGQGSESGTDSSGGEQGQPQAGKGESPMGGDSGSGDSGGDGAPGDMGKEPEGLGDSQGGDTTASGGDTLSGKGDGDAQGAGNKEKPGGDSAGDDASDGLSGPANSQGGGEEGLGGGQKGEDSENDSGGGDSEGVAEDDSSANPKEDSGDDKKKDTGDKKTEPDAGKKQPQDKDSGGQKKESPKGAESASQSGSLNAGEKAKNADQDRKEEKGEDNKDEESSRKSDQEKANALKDKKAIAQDKNKSEKVKDDLSGITKEQQNMLPDKKATPEPEKNILIKKLKEKGGINILIFLRVMAILFGIILILLLIKRIKDFSLRYAVRGSRDTVVYMYRNTISEFRDDDFTKAWMSPVKPVEDIRMKLWQRSNPCGFVLCVYQNILFIFKKLGADLDTWRTPNEIALHLADHHGCSMEDFMALTELFVKARYSDHEILKEDVEKSLNAYNNLKKEILRDKPLLKKIWLRLNMFSLKFSLRGEK